VALASSRADGLLRERAGMAERIAAVLSVTAEDWKLSAPDVGRS